MSGWRSVPDPQVGLGEEGAEAEPGPLDVLPRALLPIDRREDCEHVRPCVSQHPGGLERLATGRGDVFDDDDLIARVQDTLEQFRRAVVLLLVPDEDRGQGGAEGEGRHQGNPSQFCAGEAVGAGVGLVLDRPEFVGEEVREVAEDLRSGGEEVLVEVIGTRPPGTEGERTPEQGDLGDRAGKVFSGHGGRVRNTGTPPPKNPWIPAGGSVGWGDRDTEGGAMYRTIWMLLALLPGMARGQELAGPTAAETPRQATLVERSYDGSVKRLETTPEEAAVALLDLAEGVQERVATIFVERAEFLDKVVAQELDLLIRLGNAGQAGDPRGVALEGIALYQRLGPMFDEGRLVDRVAAELPPERQREYRRLVREYWEAVVGEKQAAAKPRRRGRVELLIEAKGEALGVELERSFERLLKGPGGGFDLLAGYLALRPDQEARIRPLWVRYMELVELGEGESDKAGRLFLSMLAHLDGAQRDRLRGVTRATPRPAPAKPLEDSTEPG